MCQSVFELFELRPRTLLNNIQNTASYLQQLKKNSSIEQHEHTQTGCNAMNIIIIRQQNQQILIWFWIHNVNQYFEFEKLTSFPNNRNKKMPYSYLHLFCFFLESMLTVTKSANTLIHKNEINSQCYDNLTGMNINNNNNNGGDKKLGLSCWYSLRISSRWYHHYGTH